MRTTRKLFSAGPALLIFFAAAAAAAAEKAGECPELAMPAMGKVPVVSQGSFGICYSATAVQMVDAWRFSHGDTDYARHSSIMAAALDTAEAPDKLLIAGALRLDGRRTGIDAGWSSDVLKQLRVHGVCDARNVLGGGDAVAAARVLGKLDPYYTAYGVLKYRNWNFAEPDSLAAIPGVVEARDAISRNLAACMSGLGFPLDEIPTIEQLQQALSDPNKEAFLARALTGGCDGQRLIPRIPEPSAFGDQSTSTSRYTHKLSSLLGRAGAQPVEVTFCDNVLEKTDYRGIERGGWFHRSSHSKDCAMHAALVIGQHWNKEAGRCEYRLRNSWGTDCGYKKISGWTCAGGELWVGREALARNSTKLTWLGN